MKLFSGKTGLLVVALSVGLLVIVGTALVLIGPRLLRKSLRSLKPAAEKVAEQDRAPAKPMPRLRRVKDYVPSEPRPGGRTAPLSRLLDLGFVTSSGDPLRRVSAELDGQRRYAIQTGAPSSFSYRLYIPEQAYLQFAVNQLTDESQFAETCFHIEILSGGAAESLFDRCLSSAEQGWKDSTVDLSAWAGRTVGLRFRVAGAAPAGPEQVKAYGRTWFWAAVSHVRTGLM